MAEMAESGNLSAVRFALAEAAARGIAGLGVCVLIGNLRGEAFYRRLGAQMVGEAVAFGWESEAIREAQYRFA